MNLTNVLGWFLLLLGIAGIIMLTVGFIALGAAAFFYPDGLGEMAIRCLGLIMMGLVCFFVAKAILPKLLDINDEDE